MGHPEAMNQSSLNVCSPKPDHVKTPSERNGCDTTKTIDLNFRDLSTFPRLEPSPLRPLHSITCVYLNQNKLTTVPGDLHSIIPNLQVLSVNGNELSELPVDLCELEFLQEIHVCKNKLTSLPHSFHKLKHLRILNVSCNDLKVLYPEIGQNASLEELHVSDNVLKRFPATLGLLVNLRTLDAANNQLEHIPQTVHFLTRLQVVNLKCNRLSAIPDSFSSLDNLKYVDLSENLISTLWPTFSSSHCLETIVLDSNLIQTLPPWFSQLVNICEICVAKNDLRHHDSLPLDFGNRLQRLKKLDLRGNFIEHLPESFGHLSNLQTLLLGTPLGNVKEDDLVFQNANCITSLPKSFTHLKHLVFLAAEDNQLTTLPQDFACLALLKDLRLGGNLLTSLPTSFCKLESLERCQLSRNKLKSLPEEFGNLDKLKELYLDFNKLKRLPLSMKSCVQLEVLDLRGNKFNETQDDILNVLTGLKDLKIEQSPQENNSDAIPNGEMENYSFNASTYSETWDDVEDSKSTSSGSSTHHVLSVKDEEENWDVDCQSADTMSCNNELPESDSGQFELDDEESAQYRSSGITFDVYGNPSQRIDLGIGQHRMLPYLLHRPRNVWGQREASPEEVEDQYNDDV